MRVAAALGALLVAGAAALVLALPAGAANECAGLQVCVPVAGPWVVVPAGHHRAALAVEWQLTCPRRHIVGGLDARLSVPRDRRRLPRHAREPGQSRESRRRGPSCSSRRMSAHAPRGADLPAAHRLHARCRRGRAQFRPRSRRSRPDSPVTRRVSTVRVRPGSKLVVQQCARGERLDRRLARLRVRHPHAAEREPRLEHLRQRRDPRRRASRFAFAATPSSPASARSSRCRRSAARCRR